MLSGSIQTKHTPSPTPATVKVNFQNTLFTKALLRCNGQDEFLGFTKQSTLTTEKQVLGQLLGNGGATYNLQVLGCWLVL
jgi:hypothetical protein